MTGAVYVRPLERRGIQRFLGSVADIRAVAGRNLLTYRRVPQLVVFSTIQPVVFVLLFRYVFGGAISIPGVSYVDYLMPGIFIQTAVFGSIGTAVGLSTDLNTGFLERFRSLPMARSAVLAGRTLADLTRNVFVVAMMVAIGFAVGFRVHTGVPQLVAALALVLLFGYVLSWVLATVGLVVGEPEAAQAAAFPVIAPFVFASNNFVPVSSMPDWLRIFAEHQPVSVTTQAVRTLVLGGSAGPDVLKSLAWMAAILLVFVPLSVWRYQRSA
jgi:ABC-2 type transport system permease protein/oleandomycin transport system permease protein